MQHHRRHPLISSVKTVLLHTPLVLLTSDLNVSLLPGGAPDPRHGTCVMREAYTTLLEETGLTAINAPTCEPTHRKCPWSSPTCINFVLASPVLVPLATLENWNINPLGHVFQTITVQCPGPLKSAFQSDQSLKKSAEMPPSLMLTPL